MEALTPLPLIDDFIRPYDAGQVLILLFALSIVGSIPLKSKKLLAANGLLFGLLFLLTPSSMASYSVRLLGIVLLVAAPVIYATSRR